jgi:hypothetical protein
LSRACSLTPQKIFGVEGDSIEHCEQLRLLSTAETRNELRIAAQCQTCRAFVNPSAARSDDQPNMPTATDLIGREVSQPEESFDSAAHLALVAVQRGNELDQGQYSVLGDLRDDLALDLGESGHPPECGGGTAS